LTPYKYKSSKQPVTFFQQTQNLNPPPVTAEKTSLLILLEATRVWIQKI